MGLCLVFCVFFCKPVNVVEGISLRACCSDGGVSDIGGGGGWLSSKGVMFITNNTGMDFTLKKWMGNGDWQIALATDWRTSPWMWWRCRFGCEICFLIWCIDVRLSYVSSRVWLQLLYWLLALHVRWCWLYPCLLGLHCGKRISEGGIHLIRCLALLHSIGGCHQCR